MLSIFLMMFVISLPILVYHKFCTVLDVVRKPLLFQKPPLYMTYGMLRVLLSWGSIAGIWYAGGLTAGLVAAAIYFLIGTAALRFFYEKQVRKWLPTFEKNMRKDARLPPDAPLPLPLQQEAHILAVITVKRAMKGEL